MKESCTYKRKDIHLSVILISSVVLEVIQYHKWQSSYPVFFTQALLTAHGHRPMHAALKVMVGKNCLGGKLGVFF